MARSATREFAEQHADAGEEAHTQTHWAASDALGERTIDEFLEREHAHDDHDDQGDQGDVLKGFRLAVILGGLFWAALIAWFILT